jgi:hypothetical protein
MKKGWTDVGSVEADSALEDQQVLRGCLPAHPSLVAYTPWGWGEEKTMGRGENDASALVIRLGDKTAWQHR